MLASSLSLSLSEMGRKPMPVGGASFFKVFMGDFTDKLRIPPAFNKKFNGKFVNESKLRCCTGRVWPVKLEKHEGNIFFKTGWKGFVKDNSLEDGDFLVFSYDGHSLFDVEIFDKSGCEKVVALMQNEVKQEVREHFINTAAVCMCKYIRVNRIKKSVVSTKNAGEKNQSEWVFQSASCPLKLNHPHFTVRWRTYRPYGTPIPHCFVKIHDLRDRQSMLICDPKGKFWPVKLIHAQDRCEFGSGWRDFWDGNNLEDGDRCIFEFVESVIRVHIIRADDLPPGDSLSV